VFQPVGSLAWASDQAGLAGLGHGLSEAQQKKNIEKIEKNKKGRKKIKNVYA